MDPLQRFSSELDASFTEAVEAVVGGLDREGHPCISRALSVQRENARRVVVVLDRSDGADTLDAILHTRRVTVRITARGSRRSVRLEGTDAQILDGDALRRALGTWRRSAGAAHVAASGPDDICARSRDVPPDLAAFRFRIADAYRAAPSRRARPCGAPAFVGGSPAPMPELARRLLEDGVPLSMCVASVEGTPHLVRIASVVRIDERHVAVSLSGEPAGREALLASGVAALCVADPDGGDAVRMRAIYLRTELSGPVFERLRTRVAVMGWLNGAADERYGDGADILEVYAERPTLSGEPPPLPSPRASLADVRRLSESLSACECLADLVDVTLTGLERYLNMACSMLWLLESRRQCLILLASHGYPEPGIGAELPLGQGVPGIAAGAAMPVRIVGTVQLPAGASIAPPRVQHTSDPRSRREIACPCLGSRGAQMAVPLLVQGRVVGALSVEGPRGRRFDTDEEDTLTIVAGQLAVALAMLRAQAAPASVVAADDVLPGSDEPIEVRYHRHDSSIFLDGHYLIKGVAGALLWKLVRTYVRCGVCEFSTRELRCCTAELRLPQVRDNLYARLLLLQRRLHERAAPVTIERIGRGRFRLSVDRSLRLVDDELHAA